MYINNVEIIDTFAEGFGMWASRFIITAINEKRALITATTITGFATSVIACGCEGGTDKILKPEESPDNRPGARIVFCITSPKKDVAVNMEHLLINRVGQCVLTSPTAACYNAINPTPETIPVVVGGKLKFFGDGFQISKRLPSTSKGKEARRFWRIPRMEGEFLCEDTFHIQKAFGGGNFLVLGKNVESALEACERAITEMKKVENVIMPFPGGIVSSGSKVGSKYAALKASTNDAFCPTLKTQSKNSLLKEDEECVMEIVVNALDLDSMKKAMKCGIEAACTTEGITRITAGNYGGKLGKFNIHLHELFK